MTRFLDWLGRVIMLVLAGMITLSIIGSIAAIPSGSVPSQAGMDPRDWPRPEVIDQSPRPAAAPQASPQPQPQQQVRAHPAPSPARERRFVAPAPATPPQPAEWLEAITYALFALVGIAALATLLLWRALHQWRRSAEALEALAARQD